MDTVAHTYDKYSQSSEQASQATSRLIAQLGEPITNLMNQALLNSATGINPLARLHRYLYNVLYPDDKTKTSREQTEVQKELYDQAVRAGDITDEQRKKELELKDAIEANAEAVKSRTSAYANYYALLAANKISSKFATQMGVVNANDKISSQITTNEQTKQQMLLTAAVTAYNQGNTESAKILSSVMIIDVNSKENSIRLAQELIDSQKEYNFLTQETANNLFKINQVALDMKSEIKSQYDSAKATELKTLMDLSLYEAIKKIAVGTDTLTFASMKLAETYKISTLEALRYLNVLLNVAEITPDLKAAMDVITQSAGSISNYLTTHLVEQKSFRSEFLGTEQTAAQKWIENWDNAHEKKNSNAKNNNKQLLDIQEETNKKLLQYDKDMYAKRMKAQEDYYASALQLQQLQIYDMTLNNLDLLENKNAKLDEKGREQLAKDRQQLLARENIEAYHQLRLNDAIATANTYALAGNAAFAQKYLDLQEEKNQKIADAQWKLHDTQVRLEGDPAAQLAAQKVYDEAIGNLDTYYNTRIGLAQSASRQEQEADRANRKAIITDAIDAVMKLENVDETKRQNIIDNLKIAGESINDLSGKYVTGVDAMRGSLVLLAEAMRNVTASAQILTPDQLNMFNGLGSGIGQNAGAGSTITINDSNNNTTVQVGGITVTVTSQANPDEIAATVLKTLQSQIAQRQGG
jgi:hypothetical protein